MVFLSSIDSVTGHIGNSATASKAVSAAIKSMAVNGAAPDSVNAVLPGQTETLIHNTGLNEEDLAADKMKYPLKRYARPEEIAWGVLYFLSEASSFSTGSGLVIDGGFTLQ